MQPCGRLRPQGPPQASQSDPTGSTTHQGPARSTNAFAAPHQPSAHAPRKGAHEQRPGERPQRAPDASEDSSRGPEEARQELASVLPKRPSRPTRPAPSGCQESVSDPQTDVARECNPGPPSAFDSTKFASCSSLFVAQFAAFFIDPRAECAVPNPGGSSQRSSVFSGLAVWRVALPSGSLSLLRTGYAI